MPAASLNYEPVSSHWRPACDPSDARLEMALPIRKDHDGLGGIRTRVFNHGGSGTITFAAVD
jgi:hypothetical protein